MHFDRTPCKEDEIIERLVSALPVGKSVRVQKCSNLGAVWRRRRRGKTDRGGRIEMGTGANRTSTEKAALTGLEDLIRQVPKADIHVHFEGLVTEADYRSYKARFSADTMQSEIFGRNYGSLDEFILACRSALDAVETEEDCFRVTQNYLQSSWQDGVVHVEIAVEPDVHEARGLKREALLSGLRRALAWGRQELGISGGLVLSLVRDLPADRAMSSLKRTIADRDGFIAIGLASRELNYPPSLFREVFAAARSEGFRVVVHAGEEGPPSYVWSAIEDLSADRIDHGIRACEDPELLLHIERKRVPLALAPLSNMKTGCLDRAGSAALGQLLKSNLIVSINSDDPGLFGAGIYDNYLWAAVHFGLNESDVLRIARNSLESAFVHDVRRLELLHALERFKSGIQQC